MKRLRDYIYVIFIFCACTTGEGLSFDQNAKKTLSNNFFQSRFTYPKKSAFMIGTAPIMNALPVFRNC